ncbi:MAG: ABC transporter ATP-binding protein [Methanospirillum sp.]|nr:ABC transporter ATP-binding protein [Methanospirillum sp.]
MVGRKYLLPASLLISAISSLLGILPLIFIWFIIREFLNPISETSQTLINTYAWWAAFTAVAGIAIYFLALCVSHLAAFRVEVEMRKQSMEKIVSFPLGFFDNNTCGRIRKIIDDNTSTTHMFLAHQLPDLAGSIVVPVVSLALIFVFDWRLGLACLVPLVIAFGLMSFAMGVRGRYFLKMYMDSLEEMHTEAVEYVRGIPVVKVFQQTVYSFKNFQKSIMNYKEMVSKHAMSWENPMTAYIAGIHSFAFILIPVAILLIGNSANYADIIVNLLFYILITPVFAHNIMRSMYVRQAMHEAEEAINRIDDLTNVQPLPVSSNPKPIKGNEIRFENVSFRYPGNTEKAIDNITFTVPEGKTYALVGPSGSGKTTIARLVPRFWDVDEGSVFIGGNDVREIDPKELMQNVSFVFQNTHLFKVSLTENIRYGNPDATPEEVESALEKAQCREIIDRLSQGLDTKIGTEGTYLSGGEQQRIVLARAMLKDAPIVVLDEATAFTDPENEHLILDALGKLTKGKTVLMIAHRLTSVMDVDTILVIENGKIAEQGNHQELLDMNGIYTKMWNKYQRSVQWTIGREAAYV